MGTLRVVTFDFWGTLVDGTITPERTAERLSRLHAAISGAGHACSPEDLEAAFHRAGNRVYANWQETCQDVGPPGRWALLAAELGIPEGLIAYEVVEKAYEDITLEPPPPLLEGIEQAVRGVRDLGMRTAVICNTGLAGGRVLRQVLAGHGLLDLFDVTVFSNEFGWAKPDPRIFQHTLEQLGGYDPQVTLHVGDLEELDVEGARRAGVFSARYAPGESEVETDADVVVRHWDDFPSIIRDFAAAPRPPLQAPARPRQASGLD